MVGIINNFLRKKAHSGHWESAVSFLCFIRANQNMPMMPLIFSKKLATEVTTFFTLVTKPTT